MAVSPTRAGALSALRDTLDRTGYTETAVGLVVRDDGRLGFEEGLAGLRIRPDADEPLSVLVRLFLAGEEIELSLASSALAPLDPAELGELLAVSDGTVRARVRLQPFAGLVIAADPVDGPGPDYVLGVGGSTRRLAQLTVRRAVNSVLDLGTGSGTQALLAARHSNRVIGVDVNPRALRLAQLNADLNGVDNVEWRQGDLFEPVGEERFDLVVSNPPYIVSPAREFLFRDGGLEGDEFSRSVVAGAAARLREGGFAQVLCCWVSERGGPWSETPRRWLDDSGCDAWLLHFQTESPATYALRWNLEIERNPKLSAAAAEQWLEYYRERGIEAISTGAIVLRRRDGRNWCREDELARAPLGDSGAHVERVFAAQDFLAGLTAGRDLLEVVLARAPETWLIERRDASSVVERARLAAAEELPLAGRIPPACLPVVAAMDGRRALREVVAQAAGGASADALAAEALPVVRELLARGLLVVAR